VLLSDVDGLLHRQPAHRPGGARLDVVERITPEIEAMAGDPVSGLSKGGMKTKLMAARTATAGGCAMDHRAGAGCARWRRWPRPARLHLVRAAGRSAGRAQALDRRDEAAGHGPGRCRRGAALRNSGKSLLPAGVTGGRGRFGRGDPVAIAGPTGRCWAPACALHRRGGARRSAAAARPRSRRFWAIRAARR
jgi:glutamate 5-kinase